MATQTKRRPHVGDTTWFVEWCAELAFDENGDVDRNECKEKTCRAATEEEAAAIARQVYPQTVGVFGFVEYWPAEFVAYDEDDAARYPWAGFWEATDDTQTYDGE